MSQWERRPESSLQLSQPTRYGRRRAFKPKPLGPGDALFFMHIPKTAGTAVRQVLENYIDMADVHASVQARFLIAMRGDRHSSEKFLKARYVAGHLPLRFSSCFQKKVHVVTFLRNPIDQTISYLRHLQRDGHIPTSIGPENLAESAWAKLFINPQTRWVAGAFEPTVDSFDGGAKEVNKLTDPSLLRQAKTNLRNFAFVGVVEQLSESLSAMSAQFLWNPPNHIPRANEGYYEKATSPEIREAVSSLVELDMELYEEANKILADFIKVKEFSRANTDALPFYIVQMDGVGSGNLIENWYHAEYDSGIGTWRWTGPGTDFSVNIPPIIGKEIEVVLNVTGHLSPKVVAETYLLWRDEKIRPDVWRFESGFCAVYRVPLRRDEIGHTLQLVFRSPTTFPEPGTGNNRMLGLPVKFIYINGI